jgi:hypothetical protein
MKLDVDKKYFAAAMQELADKKTDAGTFAMCVAECGGDENLSKAMYLKKRAVELAEIEAEALIAMRANQARQEKVREQSLAYSIFAAEYKKTTGVSPSSFSKCDREKLYQEWRAAQS